jgi:3-hydroxyisobutyrate dehydrogenase-like beta-hydroxyacid dehydrogenase
VITDLSARGALSRQLAARAGIEDVGSLEGVVAAADMLFSIVPPAAAGDFARRALAVIERASARPVFVDCNAVSPATVRELAAAFERAGATLVDVGIVGPAPRGGGAAPTRFYVSGAARSSVLSLELPELAMIDMGPEIGRASAIKMTYAAMNKGVDALYTAVLLAAERLGVRGELMEEFHASQTHAAERMAKRIPYLASAAQRYVGEMREIAATFESAGVSGEFHRGAEWVYAQLARTPLAQETRADLPPHRSLDDALEIFCAALESR